MPSRLNALAACFLVCLGAGTAPDPEDLWRRTFSGDIDAFFISGVGRVVAQTDAGVRAVDLRTGGDLWSRPDASRYEPLPDGHHAMVRTAKGTSVLDVHTGEDLWHLGSLGLSNVKGVVHLPERGTTLVYGETPRNGHTLVAADTATGEVRWRQEDLYKGRLDTQTARRVTYTGRQRPQVDDDMLLLDPTHAGLICLDAATGRARWHIDERTLKEPGAVSEGSADILAAGGRLFIPVRKKLVAVGAADGSILWKSERDFPRPVAQMAVTADGLLVRGAYEIKKDKPSWHPYLALLDPATGAARWTTERDGGNDFDGRSAFVIQDGRIVIALQEGLTSFDLVTGTRGPTTAMRAFEGDEYPAMLEPLSDDRFVVWSSQNVRVADLAGHVFAERYLKAPSESRWKAVGLTALMVGSGVVGLPLVPPASEPLIHTFKGTIPTAALLYVLTSEPHPSGRKGTSLVRLDKQTGREAGRVWFTERSPAFVVDRASGIVVVAEDGTIRATTFPDR